MRYRRCKVIHYWNSSVAHHAWVNIEEARWGNVIELLDPNMNIMRKWVVTECDDLVCNTAPAAVRELGYEPVA